MPRWPGQLLTIGGALLAIGGLVAGTMAVSGSDDVDPATFGWIALVGAVAFSAGLVYLGVRQLRVRRVLPPERYRGPSVFVLVGLVLVIAAVLTAPFAEDAAALLLGEGELTFLGALVLLTSTQLGLLLVSWLFVFRPNALAGLPSLPGRNPADAVRSGIGWGVVAWIGASLASYVVFFTFEALGLDPQPQAAEQALAVIDPVMAVLAIVILAPIAEEIFFRGVIFNAFLREGGRRWAFLGSSALFAVIHLSLVAAIPIFLLGLALAWVYDRTNNLLAPIAMHIVVNGASVLLALLVRYEVIALPA
ncbi:MAG TPA: type II CAAX endopeptidase family protein [Candidatus Limnocylindria bacterium]